MHCAEFESIICDYVDGTLSPAQRATFDSHLAGCAECRLLVEEQRSLLSFLEGVPEVEAPPELITRLIQDSPARKVAAERVKRGWFRRLIGPLIDPILQPRFASLVAFGGYSGAESEPDKAKEDCLQQRLILFVKWTVDEDTFVIIPDRQGQPLCGKGSFPKESRMRILPSSPWMKSSVP